MLLNKEFLEHASIIVETIAFFLVTIDLYGRQRLELLRKKILDSRPSAVSGVFLDGIKSKFLTLKLMAALTPVIAIIFVVRSFLGYTTWHDTLIYVCGWIAMGILMILTVITLMLVLNVVAIIFYHFLVFLSRVFPIDGIMLTIGSILFIVSKVVDYLNV
jgi:hypothetical protein